MKIIGFNGSPRKNGNTASLIKLILDEAQSYGAATELWHTSDLNISPCKSCFACRKGDASCAVHDDMQKLYATLASCDALVFGSPIYMSQMSGQAKIFIDRLFAEFHPRFSPQFKEENAGKRIALVFTQGNPDRSLFNTYYEYTKSMFTKLEFNVIDPMIVATGTRSQSVNEDQGLLALTKNVGHLLSN
jgi:Multimeric flavodoxin WrbA